MNSSSKMILTVLASLLPLTTIACGGSTGAVDPTTGEPTQPAQASQDDGGAQGSSDSGNSGTGSTQNDAGASANDGGGSTTVTTNCTGVTGPTLCVEDTHGKPGDIVNLQVDYIGTSQCTESLEVSGHLVMSDSFILTNPIQQVDCISRDNYGAPAPGTTEIMWDNFGANAISACPNTVKPGVLDKIQVEIVPGTPSGDYDVTWGTAGLAVSDAACAMVGSGVSGHIHVD